ncbi:hypothetical protein ILUMI_03356 [Ignelater luminosus]|uniref:Uncharacterized protein n=1 Tax=Ignelater luminosus TaxID=2038154 RepID=A0A8K0DBQ1_IGNLU|nr:hypothetical protein ILUMI_03356 [Ignelater luminosus]
MEEEKSDTEQPRTTTSWGRPSRDSLLKEVRYDEIGHSILRQEGGRRRRCRILATINKGRKIKTKAGKEKLRSVIDPRKLKSKKYKRRYQETIREEICLKAAKEVCGRKVSEKIRFEVKTKKGLWKRYLASKSVDVYEKYTLQRKRVKECIKLEKTKSWKEFGKKMEADYKRNQKPFFKALKNMRTTQKQSVTSIRNLDGKLVTKEVEVMERWLKHFKSVLE